MESLLPIRDGDLANLNQHQAVDLFRTLLWEDADQAGIPLCQVRITHRINVSDGGIDAVVEADSSVRRADALIPGVSSFQIKSGLTFKPHFDSHIKQELFGKKQEPCASILKSSIRKCLEEDGTYVLVCFGSNPTEKEHTESIALLQKYFAEAGFPDARQPRIYGTTQILGFIRHLPVLADAIAKRRRYRFESHGGWSSKEDMQTCLKLGEEQQAAIDQISSILIEGNARHIRVAGEPGVGKTRLVLEATRHPSIACKVAYYEDPVAVLEDQLINDLRADGSAMRAIIVIDDCSAREFSPLWNKLAACGDRVRVITIAHDESDDRDTELIQVPPLGTKEICKILGDDGPLGFEVHRWAEFCEGSPRFAHLIRQSLMTDCDQILKEPSVEAVVDRIVAGRDPLDSTEVKHRRIILRYIALFQRFGFEQPVNIEGEAIALLIQKNHPEIGIGDFQGAITELRRRRILQGRKTIYIVPKALQILLWREWWDYYGLSFEFATISKLPGNLFGWFTPLLRYARDSKSALAVVRQVLGDNGSFENLEILDKSQNARFFSYLTEADPSAALARLEKLLGTATSEDLRKLHDGRYWITDSLQMIVVWRDLFQSGARLLLKLATSASKDLADNSETIFCGLFSSGAGGNAITEASPDERFLLLAELLESEVEEERRIGRAAAKVALSLRPDCRGIGSAHQGFRRQPDYWHPKTWGELHQKYRRIWNLLESNCNQKQGPEFLECAKGLFESFLQLIQCEWICEECLGTIERFSDNEILVDSVIDIILRSLSYHEDELPLDVGERLRNIHERIVEKSFQSRLKRYVGTNYSADYIDESGWKKTAESKVKELADYALKHVSEMTVVLPWLVNEADCAYAFGMALSDLDQDRQLLPLIIQAQREVTSDRNPGLLAGYLKPIADQDNEEWNDILETLANEEKMNRFLIYIIWACDRLCDETAVRITKLLKCGEIDPLQLWILRWGRQIEEISPAIIEEWIAIALQGEKLEYKLLSLQLVHKFYCDRKEWKKLPLDLCIRILIQKPLFECAAEDSESCMSASYHWSQLANELIAQYQDEALPVISMYLSHEGNREGIFGRYDMQCDQVFFEFVSHCTEIAWNTYFAELEKRDSEEQAYLLDLLGGHRLGNDLGLGCWLEVPLVRLWQWIDELPERRIRMVGRRLPTTLWHQSRPTITREFVHRYGSGDNAKHSLYERFWGGTIIGKRSEHHRKLVSQVMEWKNDEQSITVNNWIDGLIDYLNTDIERSEIEEERDRWL